MHTIVSPTFRQFILNKYPALPGSDPFLRFFGYLCFSNFFDDESHRLVIPTKTMSEEFYQQPYHPSFNGRAVLEQFRDRVLPGLVWTEHVAFSTSSYGGKAREIITNGFDADMLEALRQECVAPESARVDLITGLPYQRKDRYRETAEATAEYEIALALHPLNETQRSILDYLRGISAGHLFLRKLTDNGETIRAAIESLPEKLQDIRYRILACVRRNPTIYYAPSQEQRTCRLSGSGDCILGLKKEVRKAACKGWVECDLRSSQFAILAAKLNAPTSQAFIASGASIWKDFYYHTHGAYADPPSDLKKVFKEAIYSLCFGKGEAKLKAFLRENGVAHLLQHPIMVELLKLRRQWFEQIDRDGGAADVWGQWQALDRDIDPKTGKAKRWAGSVAAAVIQSVEMAIISPIFEVAQKHGKSDQFTICLFQHDGATISFQSHKKQDRAQRKLKTAVEARASQLGVATTLEFAQL
jgi:hypothetical protein